MPKSDFLYIHLRSYFVLSWYMWSYYDMNIAIYELLEHFECWSQLIIWFSDINKLWLSSLHHNESRSPITLPNLRGNSSARILFLSKTIPLWINPTNILFVLTGHTRGLHEAVFYDTKWKHQFSILLTWRLHKTLRRKILKRWYYRDNLFLYTSHTLAILQVPR
jgi:hypothetical protein